MLRIDQSFLNTFLTQLEQMTQENTSLVDQTTRASNCLLTQKAELPRLVDAFQIPAKQS